MQAPGRRLAESGDPHPAKWGRTQVDLSTPDGPARLVAAAGPRVDVLVNSVDPGPVATDLWLGADGVAAAL